MGFSNQLTAIAHSAIMARALGRTLVLPHLIWPRASAVSGKSWVPFHEVFDPIGVANLFPGLEYVHADFDMLAGMRPHRILALEPRPIFDKLHNVFSKSLGWSAPTRVGIHSHRLKLESEDKIYQGLGSCGDNLMVLDGLYNAPFRAHFTEAFHKQLWTTLFRPVPLVEHMVLKVRQAITGNDLIDPRATEFGCLHVRLGDFSKVCSAPSYRIGWLANIYAAGRHCNVSADAMIARANSMELNKVLIISDSPDKLSPILDSLAATGVWTSTDIRAMIKDILPQLHPNPSKQFLDVVTAVTEQQVCSAARFVILNGFSTFSRSVLYYRGEREGVEYW
jgi:hypothetical protein